MHRPLRSLLLLGTLLGMLTGLILALVRGVGRGARRGAPPRPTPAAPLPATTPTVPAPARATAPEASPEVEAGPTPGPAPSPTPSPAPVITVAPSDRDVTWVAAVAGGCPDGYPIKAKVSSGIFHRPGGLSYERTRPDRCYPDAATAEADGFRAAKR